MKKLKVLDLFSGIGGFSLGLERTGGFETVAFCEIEEFPRRVLAKHWPKVKQYEDVRNLTADVLRSDGIAVDVICGGFPCQDISTAGRQEGIGDGTRSGLWSEITRLVGEVRPKFAIVENVTALLSGPSSRRGGWFGRVLGDLASIGYDAEWQCIPASAVGAYHRRDRVWIVAYPNSLWELQQERCEQNEWRWVGDSRQNVSDSSRIGSQGQGRAVKQVHPAPSINWEINRAFNDSGWASEPDVGRMANGVPNGSHRIKGLGNAVVPKIPELIGNAILKSLKEAA
jgi:DNA (cytosine-5)-methyltransferase 1